MHPAYSVIFFTTASGAGFGMLALLGVLAPAGAMPLGRWFGLAALVVAFGFAVSGLLSSTLHLRRPSRAIFAFSQWRSSWLSREGVAAVATFIPALIFAAGWVALQRTDGWWTAAGLLAALGAVATVFSTGKIYAVLKPIRQWHHPLVVPIYLLFALASGGAWLTALRRLFAGQDRWFGAATLAALAVAWAVKWLYWRRIDRAAPSSTPESATGLGRTGGGAAVRSLMQPHSEDNYLLKEMGYRVARKHALKLRAVAVLLGGVVPIVLIAASLFAPSAIGAAAALAAAVCATAGIFVERWLFFAEARHSVTLYY